MLLWQTPALITREFLDLLSDQAPASLRIWALVALLVAYQLGDYVSEISRFATWLCHVLAMLLSGGLALAVMLRINPSITLLAATPLILVSALASLAVKRIEKYRRAIRQAVMEEDLAELEAGLETPVGPRGVKLSGDQVQRAAAARCFVRQPELLVLDDLSSALVVETEQRLWQRLFGRDGARSALSGTVTPTDPPDRADRPHPQRAGERDRPAQPAVRRSGSPRR